MTLLGACRYGEDLLESAGVPEAGLNAWLLLEMFYCSPSAPYQKGSCENNHEMIRRIIPKGEDIGQYTQEQIDLMMSHINSYARKRLGNKSPYEMFEFQYGKEPLDVFHLQKIPADEIILSPELLK